MQARGIQRVCCLLDDNELARYGDWITHLEATFGEANVCHGPITDHEAIDESTLQETVLPFLDAATDEGAPTVVHCSAGLGRTGHVLALWLAHDRGLDLETAVETVRTQRRRPLEAADLDELRALL